MLSTASANPTAVLCTGTAVQDNKGHRWLPRTAHQQIRCVSQLYICTHNCHQTQPRTRDAGSAKIKQRNASASRHQQSCVSYPRQPPSNQPEAQTRGLPPCIEQNHTHTVHLPLHMHACTVHTSSQNSAKTHDMGRTHTAQDSCVHKYVVAFSTASNGKTRPASCCCVTTAKSEAADATLLHLTCAERCQTAERVQKGMLCKHYPPDAHSHG